MRNKKKKPSFNTPYKPPITKSVQHCTICGKTIEYSNIFMNNYRDNKFCSIACWTLSLPVCKTCKKSIADEVFTSSEKETFCSLDCWRKTLPKCKTCGKNMEEFLPYNGNNYCSQKCIVPDLPKCSDCGIPITTFYYKHDDCTNKYCEICFGKTCEACAVCNKPAIAGYTDIDGKVYCSKKCFRTIIEPCIICGKRNQKMFKLPDGKIYCSKKCYSTTLEKCPNCNAEINK